MIACTPFIASAFDVSSCVIAAWWCGERSAFAQSVLADADVVDVLRPAGDVADAVVAREACADGLHAGLP